MQESEGVTLGRISISEIEDFRRMAYDYWQELMPHAPVNRDDECRQAYFLKTFIWSEGNHHPFWALVDGRRVGFVSFEAGLEKKSAYVNDFYITPDERRKGYGAATVRALCNHFDALQIEMIELNVRRDNPRALAFWEAQGFRIGSYRMRQYRDPATHTGFIGALSSDFTGDGA